jgi:hypothetical protein
MEQFPRCGLRECIECKTRKIPRHKCSGGRASHHLCKSCADERAVTIRKDCWCPHRKKALFRTSFGLIHGCDVCERIVEDVEKREKRDAKVLSEKTEAMRMLSLVECCTKTIARHSLLVLNYAAHPYDFGPRVTDMVRWYVQREDETHPNKRRKLWHEELSEDKRLLLQESLRLIQGTVYKDIHRTTTPPPWVNGDKPWNRYVPSYVPTEPVAERVYDIVTFLDQ